MNKLIQAEKKELLLLHHRIFKFSQRMNLNCLRVEIRFEKIRLQDRENRTG